MSSRHNFLDADNSIMERNLRFVTNDLEDNLNQYFGGSGSRGHNPAISAPPRDYKVVQPKPDISPGYKRRHDLDERREFLLEMGLARHVAYDVAKKTSFDVQYCREKREEWLKQGYEKTLVDKQLLVELQSYDYKCDKGISGDGVHISATRDSERDYGFTKHIQGERNFLYDNNEPRALKTQHDLREHEEFLPEIGVSHQPTCLDNEKSFDIDYYQETLRGNGQAQVDKTLLDELQSRDYKCDVAIIGYLKHAHSIRNEHRREYFESSRLRSPVVKEREYSVKKSHSQRKSSHSPTIQFKLNIDNHHQSRRSRSPLKSDTKREFTQSSISHSLATLAKFNEDTDHSARDAKEDNTTESILGEKFLSNYKRSIRYLKQLNRRDPASLTAREKKMRRKHEHHIQKYESNAPSRKITRSPLRNEIKGECIEILTSLSAASLSTNYLASSRSRSPVMKESENSTKKSHNQRKRSHSPIIQFQLNIDNHHHSCDQPTRSDCPFESETKREYTQYPTSRSLATLSKFMEDTDHSAKDAKEDIFTEGILAEKNFSNYKRSIRYLKQLNRRDPASLTAREKRMRRKHKFHVRKYESIPPPRKITSSPLINEIKEEYIECSTSRSAASLSTKYINETEHCAREGKYDFIRRSLSPFKNAIKRECLESSTSPSASLSNYTKEGAHSAGDAKDASKQLSGYKRSIRYLKQLNRGNSTLTKREKILKRKHEYHVRKYESKRGMNQAVTFDGQNFV